MILFLAAGSPRFVVSSVTGVANAFPWQPADNGPVLNGPVLCGGHGAGYKILEISRYFRWWVVLGGSRDRVGHRDSWSEDSEGVTLHRAPVEMEGRVQVHERCNIIVFGWVQQKGWPFGSAQCAQCSLRVKGLILSEGQVPGLQVLSPTWLRLVHA